MTVFDPEIGFVSEDYKSLLNQNAQLQSQVEVLQESWDEAAQALLRLKTEDEGWNIFGQQVADDGFTLSVVKDIAKKAEIQATGNPLLKAAYELRFNPIFSRGFHLQGDVKPRYQKKLDNPTVQETLFEEEGLDKLERTCFNIGNLFVAYNRITGDMMRIPFAEISNRAVDPDFPTRTAYYQWTRDRLNFDGSVQNLVEWIPVVEWSTAGKDTIDEIAQHPVNHDWTIIDLKVNTPTSGVWGVPDSFPALTYAWAYTEYIRDATSMLKALNMFAWKVVGKSKGQAQASGIALSGNRRTAAIASMTEGTDLSAMPKSGIVDMEDGRAIAALVASSTGVSAPALLALAEGNSAATHSMDSSTVSMARARQKIWKNFYRRVFLAMGIEGVTITFPKISEDPIHRQISSLATVRATGAVWADEYRKAALEALSIVPLHEGTPPVEEYAPSSNGLGYLAWEEGDVGRVPAGGPGRSSDPIARQGNPGVAGKLGEVDNTNRDLDRKAGEILESDIPR